MGKKFASQPRELLQAIPGLKLIEMDGSDRCCGSAGIYNLTHADMSQQLLKEKMQAVSAAQRRRHRRAQSRLHAAAPLRRAALRPNRRSII